jgi:hypothetical protein
MTAIATSQGATELGNAIKLTDGFQAAFIGAGVVAVLGAALSLALMRKAAPAATEAEPASV